MGQYLAFVSVVHATLLIELSLARPLRDNINYFPELRGAIFPR